VVNPGPIKVADFRGGKRLAEQGHAVLPFGFAHDGHALNIAEMLRVKFDGGSTPCWQIAVIAMSSNLIFILMSQQW